MLLYKIQSINPTDSDSINGKKKTGEKERGKEAGEICNNYYADDFVI